MPTFEGRWRVLAPPDAVEVRVPRGAAEWGKEQQRLRELPAGTPVVLLDAVPGSSRRCRDFAARAGVTLHRHYLAFPSLRVPAYVVEDSPTTLRYFCSHLLTVPPGTNGLSSLAQAAVGVARALASTGLIGAVVPGRVVVGRRS